MPFVFLVFDTLRIYAVMHKNVLPAAIVAILGIAGFAFTIVCSELFYKHDIKLSLDIRLPQIGKC